MTSIPPIPFFRDLRDECLQRSEKRMPKWKFRLAPDLVLQLQPKATYLPTPRQTGTKIKLVQFDGVAVMVATGTATAEMFNRLLSPSFSYTGNWWRLTFEVFAYSEDEWHLHLRSYYCTRGATDGIPILGERIIGAFTGGFFTKLTADAFLGHYCLLCGKGLTDPVSMARRIGPECAGTSSLTVPFIITPKDEQALKL